jgi:Tol biopolymer transport system component
MHYSNDGKCILLEQQFYTDWRINRDRPNRAEILDVASGKILLTRNGVNSAALTPDSKSLITLEDGTVYFWNIISGAEERKFTPHDATYSVAISPDGNTLVVSQKPTESDLKNIPSIREDKKAIKEAIKLQEVAVFYDAKTFAYKYIATDIFDIVFSMRFSPDGSSLYLFNAPNRKRISPGQGGSSRHGYIQIVNPQNGEVSRVIFSTNAPTPTYKESPDGKYFTTTSIEQKFYVFTSVVLFDRATGSMLKNFQNDFRLMENTHNGKSAVEFLPDRKTIALGYGYKLALWNFTE